MLNSQDRVYSIASLVLRKKKNKKEVNNDLLSKMAPPTFQSCSINSKNRPFNSIYLYWATLLSLITPFQLIPKAKSYT